MTINNLFWFGKGTMRCNNRIPLGSNRAETYCVLDTNHKGKCEPDPSIKAKYPDKAQAQASSREGNGLVPDIPKG